MIALPSRCGHIFDAFCTSFELIIKQVNKIAFKTTKNSLCT